MEIKKSPKAGLKNKRGLFLQIGLIIVLIVVIILFEWTPKSVRNVISIANTDDTITAKKPHPFNRQLKPKSNSQIQSSETKPTKVADELIEEDSLLKETPIVIENQGVSNVEPQTTQVETPVEAEKAEDAPVYYYVEEMPEFPGGSTALTRYLGSVRYPSSAIEEGIEGKVYISFVVNVKGLIEQAKVARGVDPILDNAALNQVINMPAWTPGKHGGKPVKVSYTVPINFVLQKR